jgi:hypothetical protein
MNNAKAIGAAILGVAVITMGSGLALRLHRSAAPVPTEHARGPVSPPVPNAIADEKLAQGPGDTSPPRPASPPDRDQFDGTSLPFWQDAQSILMGLVGDERRRRECLRTFVDMVGRVREIEKARVRYLVEGEKTVIEIPAFREEGRSIRSEWRTQVLPLLTSEEGSRFTAFPEFETGRLSPELDLLRVANLFSGSRHGKEMEPEFFWDDTTRIEAQALGNGKVQIRTGTTNRTTFSQFENQQEALNHLNRAYGHLLGPIPQLFR